MKRATILPLLLVCCTSVPVKTTEIRALDWAATLRALPDPQIVTDAAIREDIVRTGLPWHVVHEETGIELILVPPGEFLRGAPDGDAFAREEEQPAHPAIVREPFYIGRFEVTQEQWERVTGDSPSEFANLPSHPVENVTVPEVHRFVREIGFVLPTEIEWEYACRARTTAARYGELDEIAWHVKNSEMTTHPVGEKLPNAFGLHDMIGNVWELTRGDWGTEVYERFAEEAPIDPARERETWRRSYYQSFRGGSWIEGEVGLRATTRQRFSPGYGFDVVGFRVMRMP